MDKNERYVKKHYANAEPVFLEDGYHIVADDLDLNSEFLLGGTMSKAEAWAIAKRACKTLQQFNRTHPDRMTLELSPEKFEKAMLKKQKRNKKR